MSTQTIHVNASSRAYDVTVGTDLTNELTSFIDQQNPLSVLFVTESNVVRHWPEFASDIAPTANAVVLPNGERTKSVAQLQQIWDAALDDRNLDRTSIVIAHGGGVVGDIAGFAAATLLRGIPFVQVPTTLMAMVDSSIGGKTAINHSTGKNLIGAFHQPSAVFCDLQFLSTLPEREYRSALAEVVKAALIDDADFFDWIEGHTDAIRERDPDALQRLIRTSIEIKARIVEQDEFEKSGKRALLNLGHTLAHVLEARYPSRYLHAEAVAIGLMPALDGDLRQRTRRMLRTFELATEPPEDLTEDIIIEYVASDKKRRGDELLFIHADTAGATQSTLVPLDDIGSKLLEPFRE